MNAHDLGGFAAGLMMVQTQPEMTATQPGASQAPPGVRVPGASGTPGATGATQQQTVGGTGATGGGSAAPGGFNMIWMLFLFLIVMVVMTSMTGRKEKRRRASLMSSLKRGDKVQTTAGIIGTIVELGDNEAVLRVDEVSNTRIRFARTAISGVIQAKDGSKTGEVEAKPKAETANT